MTRSAHIRLRELAALAADILHLDDIVRDAGARACGTTSSETYLDCRRAELEAIETRARLRAEVFALHREHEEERRARKARREAFGRRLAS